MDRLALKIKLFASHLLIIALVSTFVVCPVFAEETFTESQQIVKEVLSESEDITGTSLESDITIDTEVISVLSEDEVSKKIVADPVQIDADLVTYQDHSGIAIAQGSVKVRNKNLLLLSPYVEYDTTNGILDAYSDAKESVVIVTSADKLVGHHLRYNLITRQGVLTQASGTAESLYMRGENVYIMSAEAAKDEGLVSRKGKYLEDDMIANWTNVSSTTCDFEEPHYRLETKKAIIIPNQKIILKRPKFYMGKRKLFTYPFDYIIALQKREQSIMPFFLFDTYTGAGLGIRGNLDFNKYGEINIAAIGWSKGMWEAKVRYQKEVLDRLWIFAQSDRLYNRDEKDTLWRPQWGANYTTRSGWTANLLYSQRELIETTVQPGLDKRFDIWRDPEFKLTSPWYGPTFAKFNFVSMYGRYQHNTRSEVNPWTKRLALIVNLSGNPEVSWNNFKPYYGGNYTYYDYDSGLQKQKSIDAWVGLSWHIGSFNFVSQYAQRWVNGSSMQEWDRLYARKDFYQAVSFPLPFGKSWEKWNLSIASTYDVQRSMLGDVTYSLNYNRHCMTWQFWVRDKAASDEKQMGLTFYINAFPEYKIGIGSDTLGDKSSGF